MGMPGSPMVRRRRLAAELRSIRESSGIIVGASIIARDITKAKADEREIRDLNEELEQRNRVLERSNIELQQFAYVASHDLREPRLRVESSCGAGVRN